jgi:hypothetical protein
MLGRKAVNRQAVVAAIHFGDSEANAVTRPHVKRLAQGAEQGGPCVERDRALREGRHHIWGEPDVLGERIKSRFESTGTCSGFGNEVLGIIVYLS